MRRCSYLFTSSRKNLFSSPRNYQKILSISMLYPFKELFFDVEPGVRINGLHFYVKAPKGLILYFHGNSRSIKGWAKYARDFFRYQYDVVLVDYRGFGKSTGKRSERDMLTDMQFVYNTLLKTYEQHHLIVYGRSLGSGFATKIASDNTPRYLILDCSLL